MTQRKAFSRPKSGSQAAAILWQDGGLNLQYKTLMRMIQGFKKVRCPRCGYRFRAAVIENEATAESMPVHCPKCGKEVSLKPLINLLKHLFCYR